MQRIFAALLASAISLVGFAALFAAVSWFMRSTLLFWTVNHSRSGHILASMIPIFVSVFMVPFLVLSQRRNGRAKQADQSGVCKPAPRLWERLLRPSDE